MTPSPEANQLQETSGVTQVPADAPPAPPAPPTPPTEPPAPAEPDPGPGQITFAQFLAESPVRSVPGAAMAARDPEVVDLQLTDAEWQKRLDDELATPTGPQAETPTDG